MLENDDCHESAANPFLFPTVLHTDMGLIYLAASEDDSDPREVPFIRLHCRTPEMAFADHPEHDPQVSCMHANFIMPGPLAVEKFRDMLSEYLNDHEDELKEQKAQYEEYMRQRDPAGLRDQIDEIGEKVLEEVQQEQRDPEDCDPTPNMHWCRKHDKKFALCVIAGFKKKMGG